MTQWSQSQPDWDSITTIFTTRVGDDAVVYVAPHIGVIRAYDIATRAQRGEYQIPRRGWPTLIAVRGRDAYIHDPSFNELRVIPIA